MLPVRLDRDEDGSLSVLCLGAHADDIEIGAAGTLLQLAQGVSDLAIRWIVLSGDARRAREARDSAEQLLGDVARLDVDVLDFRDGYFPDAWSGIKDALEATAAGPPLDLVLTHYAEDRHQDHRTVTEAARSVFRDHLILEYEIPKYDGDLGRPNLYVPLPAESLERKARHLTTVFESQLHRNWMTEETVTSLARLRGIECGATYAEAFHATKAVLSWGETLA